MSVIEGEGYRVVDQAEENRVLLHGTLRLGGGEEYAPILALLTGALDRGGSMTVDLSGLEFLNSSGIAMLSRFVIEARNRSGVAVVIRGSRSVPWQGKSLKNLKRLMPALDLELG